MVSNIPTSLRDEKKLRQYFEYYMTRKVEKPSMGITLSTQPGFLNKSAAFLFNRAKRIPEQLLVHPRQDESAVDTHGHKRWSSRRTLDRDVPAIERVVLARKMTELASLLERREAVLVLLETAHIKLVNEALTAVKDAMERKAANKPIAQVVAYANKYFAPQLSYLSSYIPRLDDKLLRRFSIGANSIH